MLISIPFFLQILDFGKSKNLSGAVDENYYRYFLTEANSHHLTAAECAAFFKDTFTYYHNPVRLIEWDVAKGISYYFRSANEADLKGEVLKKHKDRESEINAFSNLVLILYFIKKFDVAGIDNLFWRQHILKMVKKYPELSSRSLAALEKISDASIIPEMKSLWASGDAHAKDAIINLCGKLDPNHDDSIFYFIEGIKHELFHAKDAIADMREPKRLEKFLEALNSDEKFLNSFFARGRMDEKKNKMIINNLRAAYSPKIEALIKKIIYKSDIKIDADQRFFF